MNVRMLAVATITGAALLTGAVPATAHTISIGYENAGAGSVTVWLGTYSTGHAAITNEGSLKLEGVDVMFGPTTTAFDLLSGPGLAFKPAGLVDGTTNFYAPNIDNAGAALVASEAPFNASCQACGRVDRWQGVTFNGLMAGTYQFTWVPAASPTLQWDILNNNFNGQFDLSGVVNPPPPVPEPATMTLLAFALAGGVLARRRRSTV